MAYKYLKPITDQFGIFTGKEEKEIEITDDLLGTLKQTGRDFFNFLPIDIIERFFKENENNVDIKTLSNCLNNLHLNVFRGKLGESEYDGYKISKNGNSYDNPPKEMKDYEEKIFKSDKEKAIIYHSQKRRNQTQYEVDVECKNAAKECGFNIDDLVKDFYEIRSLNTKLYDLDEENDKEEIEKINQFKKNFLLKMSKIYLLLRKQGYSHTDIT